MKGRSAHAYVIAAFLGAAGLLSFSQEAAPGPASASPTTSAPPVTLEECVAAAKSGAPGLKLAGIALDSARAALRQVQGANALTLGATTGYSHQGDVPGVSQAAAASAGSALPGGTGENIQAGLSLAGPATSVDLTGQHAIADESPVSQATTVSLSGSQTVFDGYPGGRASAAVRAADYTYQVAQVTYDSSLKSLVYQVKQAYYTLLGDQSTVQVREATVKQASDNVNYVQGLFGVQRATKLDVLQVQFTLNQAQLDLRSAENAVETDRKKLSLAIGWPLDKQYQVAEIAAPAVPSADPTAALTTAFENRPELRTLALNRASADVSLKLQKSQYSPVVSLTGSLDVGQNWTTNVNSGTFSAGVKIALPPIYDAGQQSAKVQQASDQVSSFAVQDGQQRQSITIDVQSALFGVNDAQNRLDLAQLNVQQAQGQYDLEKARYAVGLRTTLDVLTAFSTLTTAQVGLVQARSNYALAILNLSNVMGL